MFELDSNQVVVLGMTASILTLVLRFIYELLARKKLIVPQWAMLLLVYLVSQGLAVLWFPQVFPPLPILTGDPSADMVSIMNFLTGLTTSLIALLGFAKLLYDKLIAKVKFPIGNMLMPRLYRLKKK